MRRDNRQEFNKTPLNWAVNWVAELMRLGAGAASKKVDLPKLAKGLSLAWWLVFANACSHVPVNSADAKPKAPELYKGANGAANNLPFKWWSVYNDEVLNGLVETTLKDNPNLGVVYARLKAAQAMMEGTKSARRLHLDAGAGAAYGRSSENTALGEMLGGQSIRGDQYTLNTSASWEPDLWKRVTHAVEAADAKIVMSKIDIDQYVLILSAEVVAYYWQVRAAEAEIALLQNMLAKREEAVSLLGARLNNGFIDEIDVARARIKARALEVDIDDARKRRSLAVHGLATLTAQPIAEFSVPTMAAGTQLPPPPQVSPGLPAVILARRADLAESTQLVRANLAQRQIADAAFYPSIRLTSNFGFASKELDNLLRADSREFNWGPLAFTLPILDGRRNKANVAIAEAHYQEAIATHKSRLLLALREVDDALLEIKSSEENATAFLQSAQDATRATEIERLRYGQGVVSFLTVLEGERKALAVQRKVVKQREHGLLASVQLIRALGGGWNAGEGWSPDEVRQK